MQYKEPREPLVAWALTFLLPGLGQFYSGDKKKGVIFILAQVLLGAMAFFYVINPYTRLFVLLYLFLIPYAAFNIYILIDAHRGVVKYNTENKLKPKTPLTQKLFAIICMVVFLFIFNPLTAIFTFYVRAEYVRPFDVLSDGMAPAIFKDDKIFVDMFSYNGAAPKRWDVVLVKDPRDPKGQNRLIKRIVGLPGETVEIKDGMVYVNSKPLVREGQGMQMKYENAGNYARPGQRLQLPPDSYFILGDNTINSFDSRHFGFVPGVKIVGKVYKIYYPFSRSGRVI